MKSEQAIVENLKPEQIAGLCDHTFLQRSESFRCKGEAIENPVKERERRFYQFLEEVSASQLQPYAVCVRPEDAVHARRFLDAGQNQAVKLAAVAGFPDGSWYSSQLKLFEVQYALDEGADEIDFVLNVQALKNGDHSFVLHELQQAVRAVHSRNGILKLIVETSELTPQELIHGCRLASHTGVDMIKTSTGFSSQGAAPESLAMIRSYFGGGIKVSGGVNLNNVYSLLGVLADEGKIPLDPSLIRIGETRLLGHLEGFFAKA